MRHVERRRSSHKRYIIQSNIKSIKIKETRETRTIVLTTMARGAASKLRRRNRKKEADEGVIDMFGEGDKGTFEATEEIPLPPGMKKEADEAAAAAAEESTDDDEDNLPKKGKKGRKKGLSKASASSGGGGGIKRTPLILLILLTGTTLLPALIYAGDYLSSFLAQNNVLGAIGFRLGIGSVPRKRVLSFYEKHAPEKVNDVPHILSKYYGDYPTLIKKLERKYQDYGYFLGWEEDEAPMRLAMEQLQSTYTDVWLVNWNRYAPQILKTGARNIRYNLTFLVKKFRKVWKRQIWPWLEPIFGVPDEAAARKQKRKDAAEARARKQRTAGTRRKNTDFRDEEED